MSIPNIRKERARRILCDLLSEKDLSFNPDKTEKTLLECIEGLRKRRKTGAEVQPEFKATVQRLCRNLQGFVEADSVQEACVDPLMIDIIVKLMKENLNPIEIIQEVLRRSASTVFEHDIRPLLDNQPDITEDKTLYVTMPSDSKNSSREEDLNKNEEIIGQIPKNPMVEKTAEIFKKPQDRNIDSNPAKVRQQLHTPYVRRSKIQDENEEPAETNPFFPRYPAYSTPKNASAQIPYPSLSQSTIMPIRNVSIKDAIEFIPKFDGFNISLHVFLDGCREAMHMLPALNEPDLARLIKMRLSGEALKSTQGKSFVSIDEIAQFLENLFGSSKNYNQLSGELSAQKQKREENVITYSNRIKLVADELREAARRENRIHRDFDKQLEKDKIEAFIRGLHWVTKARMGNFENIDDAIAAAIEIERDFACQEQEDISQAIKHIRTAQEQTIAKEVKIIETQKSEQCQICRKQNHTACDAVSDPTAAAWLGLEHAGRCRARIHVCMRETIRQRRSALASYYYFD